MNYFASNIPPPYRQCIFEAYTNYCVVNCKIDSVDF